MVATTRSHFHTSKPNARPAATTFRRTSSSRRPAQSSPQWRQSCRQIRVQTIPTRSTVSFQWKNPDFLFKNPDFLSKNPDFLLKSIDFIIIKQATVRWPSLRNGRRLAVLRHSSCVLILNMTILYLKMTIFKRFSWGLPARTCRPSQVRNTIID